MTSPDGEHIPNLNITVELPSEDYGAGIWCGIAFLLCGYVAFRYDSSFNSKYFHIFTFANFSLIL